VKENRYRMEETNFYRGIDNVTIHTVEHDIVLPQDIIFDYLTTGKKSPVLKLNYWTGLNGNPHLNSELKVVAS